MTQTTSAREIQQAGGLPKWIAKQARGRTPKDAFIGYDIDRMNKLEAKYAGYLEAQKRAGNILFWRYESVKFRLADKTWYTPDFYVMMPDGAIEIHETKGFWEDDARVKIKATAAQFPELLFRAVQLVGGQWKVETFNGRGV